MKLLVKSFFNSSEAMDTRFDPSYLIAWLSMTDDFRVESVNTSYHYMESLDLMLQISKTWGLVKSEKSDNSRIETWIKSIILNGILYKTSL